MNCTILFNGPPQRKEVIIGFAYRNIDIATRNNRMTNAAIQAIDESGLHKALVIGTELINGMYPYSVLAIIPVNKSEE